MPTRLNLTAFAALVRKDLLIYLASRRALVLSLVAPILIAAFFGSLFGGKNTKVSHVPVAVTDLDQSPLSQDIVRRLQAEPALAVKVMPADAAAAEVRKGELRAAITLPVGFGEQAQRGLFGGPKPEVALVVDPSQAMVVGLVQGLLTQHAMAPISEAAFRPNPQLLTDWQASVAQAPMPAAEREALQGLANSIGRVQAAQAARADAGAASAPPAGMAMGQPFTLKQVAAIGPGDPAQGYDSYAHSFAGMGVQFILMLGVDFGVGLLALRRTSLWQRLQAAPMGRGTLVGSRWASATAIAAGVFTVLWLVAVLAFGVQVRGSVAGLALVTLAFALMTGSFGLMIAALGGTPEATRGLAILATLLMVMLGGAWVPSFIFPPTVQAIAAWVPTTWAVNGMDAMTWRGLPFSAALAPAAVLTAFAVLFGAVALLRWRWTA